MQFTVNVSIKFNESCLAQARQWEKENNFNYGIENYLNYKIGSEDNEAIASLLFDWAYEHNLNGYDGKFEMDECWLAPHKER